MSLSRREIFKVTALATTSTALNAYSNTIPQNLKAPIADTKKKRVVVVGGGISGLTIAKYTKKFASSCDVVLVEQKDHFVSCPMSNHWLVDQVDLEFLTHNYLQAAKANNYTFFNATAMGLDKINKILHTSYGDISYDYIVFAPGIDYDYSAWTTDIAFENRLRQEYPAGFKSGSEHMTIKTKIKNFKKGNFILTIPKGNYKCLPAPYERACLIADYFKKNKLDAKVIVLDENNMITIKEEGFQTAFDQLYKNYLEYYPNSKIENIDLDNKIVETELDEFQFADAIFYPHVRGAKILEIVGIAKDTQHNKLEGNINFLTYEVIGEKDMFITGDARPMGFSKSGNTSHSEAQFVSKLIASKINNEKPPKWESPVTTCFSEVSTKPDRAIYIYTEYAYIKKSGRFKFNNTFSSENWKSDEGITNAKSTYMWAKSLYADLFDA